MTEYTELKRTAEAANAVTGDASVDITISSEHGPNQPEIDAVTAFLGGATPAAVLALIAENDRLQEAHEQICTNYNQVSYASEDRGKQIDQLKAELEHTGYDHDLLRNENYKLKAENEALRNAFRPLLAHWDDLKAGESLNVDAARAALRQGEQS